MPSGGSQRVRRDVVRRFVAAATSPRNRISLWWTVAGGGETSGSRRGRDGTAAAALGPRPTVLRPTPNTLSVGSNLIQCTSCQKWAHKKCSGIKGSMCKVMKSFICTGCLNPVISTGPTSVDIGASANLEVVDKFCYLGDMLSVDGDADAAVEARFRIGCNKFRQLVPLLTNRDISLIRRGRLYCTCV